MQNIESRVLGILRKQKKTPISLKEIAKMAGVRKKDTHELMKLLTELEKSNKLINKNGRYALVEGLGLLKAQIVKVSSSFGFARIDGAEKDIFIPGRMLMGAMPGDTVLVRQKKGYGELPEGEVCKILKECERKFTGVLKISDNGAEVFLDRHVNFPVKAKWNSVKGKKDGDKVLIEITRRGDSHRENSCIVIESFGDAGKASSCCASILAANDIYPEFPLEVLEQAKAIGAGYGIHPKELERRMDLRGEIIFTMDGSGTKDIDDAVSLVKNERGWELGVHIADVSYYVTQNTPIDSEAFTRGTSVYFADSVVPMLPKELSNGICSLNPGEDRLAFSAIIQLGSDAKIESYRFEKTVINSRVQGVYSEINKILDKTAEPEILSKYSGLTDMVFEMGELAKLLTRNRVNRGSVNLESVESEIIVGEDGSAADVVPRERGASEMIIEEFMLIANEASARLAIKEKLPFVFRVHDDPAPDKTAQLYDALEKLGVSFKRTEGKVSAEQLCAILNQVRGSELEEIVNTMVLRSMAKAKYSERNTGHFGLGLDDYTHFTSPIRRYPDLTIHRVLSAYITGTRHDNIAKRFNAFAGQSSSHSTERELAAMSAERDCESAYKAEYMSSRVGEEFDGIISSISHSGCYVRLPNTIEGMIRLNSLPSGDWRFDGSISLEDMLSGARLQIGDKLRVRVISANVSAGHVDFEPVNTMSMNRKY